MKPIPRFSHEDTGEIESLLADKGIPFKNEGVNIKPGPYGAGTEYIFHVPDEFYLSAIEAIQEYYGLIQHPEDEPSLEYCPACNSKIVNQKECSECGLSLSYTPEEAMGEHPFFIYLKQQNLI